MCVASQYMQHGKQLTAQCKSCSGKATACILSTKACLSCLNEYCVCCADHKFYYAKDLDLDECYLFVGYHSERNHATFCPHSAFLDPSTPADAPERESVEIRAYAFWQDDNIAA